MKVTVWSTNSKDDKWIKDAQVRVCVCKYL